jgi:hypothetical protein
MNRSVFDAAFDTRVRNLWVRLPANAPVSIILAQLLNREIFGELRELRIFLLGPVVAVSEDDLGQVQDNTTPVLPAWAASQLDLIHFTLISVERLGSCIALVDSFKTAMTSGRGTVTMSVEW